MPNIIEITDFHAPELDPYARLTQNQLRSRLEPEKGIFIAESPKVIARALDAGYQPLSLLMERKQITGPAQDILTLKVDGLDIWIGRNNRQNDFLTLKKAHPYDLWFHVKNQPGSHVILACHNVTPTDAQIERAAELAAYYSKARESSKVEVDCTLVRHVKKPAHAVPGYVIFTNQTTYIVEPKK